MSRSTARAKHLPYVFPRLRTQLGYSCAYSPNLVVLTPRARRITQQHHRCIQGGANGHTAVPASRTRLLPTSTSKRSIPRLPSTLASSPLLTPWLATQKQRSRCELVEKVKHGRGAFLGTDACLLSTKETM
ncbi:hypothetical protein BHM03_00009897 [Ensete ventricosum]|nr:hypothetical protein BHM03_00009897 [Ensete ventricosum]